MPRKTDAVRTAELCFASASICRRRITDAGLKELKDFASLTELVLNRTNVTDSGPRR
jgi:hypothetical protein